MKSFIKTLTIALLSAVFSLFIYDQYWTHPEPQQEGLHSPTLIPANYTVNTAGFAAERTDFTSAAAKTIDAVVHVKNTAFIVIFTEKKIFPNVSALVLVSSSRQTATSLRTIT